MGYFLADNPHPHTPQFGYPRRGGLPNGVCVVHTTESAIDYLGPDAGAENVALWIATQRTGYGSYHAIADSDSIVDMAHVMWETWHDASSNPYTFGISAAVQAGLWHTIPEARRYAIYINMAKAAAMKARECIEYGRPYPDPIHITAAQARAGVHGFVGHGEMMPETRTDPGAGFEWNIFLSAYKKEMAMGFPVSEPIHVPNPAQKGWWEVPIPEAERKALIKDIALEVWGLNGLPRADGVKQTMWATTVEGTVLDRKLEATIKTLTELLAAQDNKLTADQITKALKQAFVEVLDKEIPNGPTA